MGTYTTNYQLYTPTVGETGWGTLVNGNFTTIDTTMKSLSNRITAVENEVNGNLSCTSVTTSGEITGNGGIAGTTGTFSGRIVSSNLCTLPILRIVPISNAMVLDNTPIHTWSTAGGTGSLATMNTYLKTGVTTTFNVETLFSHWAASDFDWFVSGVAADSAVSVLIGTNNGTVSIACNGTTTSIGAGKTITITIARLNEFIRYPSTITITTTGVNFYLWCGFTKTNTGEYCVTAY